ncbi:arylamine N-acetyltransferase family protein [Humibacillus xanthopallidus]|uniref:N-hydroxyarylamine O-acetyltransferase n=1 Tax=Humibacillus xanthopallidus TaxID=412689 RepID=A0A543HFR4_9MICO|nr:arylamine N-acetyltransferase [Humibacillus xanthopallidus]TQM57178.1 N-hydroxyarylamine O-acetyltransferase [Humibacillus xanthopallidus]
MTSSTTTDAATDSLRPGEAAAYLARLGVAAPEAPTLGALASLHRAHLVRVPFENLDIALRRPIRLDLASLLAKVVDRQRGGYCYELNGLFAALLRSLGYAVDLVSARVATAEGGLTDEFDHLALVVTSPELGAAVLADVGFGDGFIDPLPLRDGIEAHEPGKDVGLAQVEGEWHYRERRRARRFGDRADGAGSAQDQDDAEAQDAGEWQTQYVFTTTAHRLSDFEPRNLWQQTSPDSHFTRQRVASRLTPTGRVTLSGCRLITTTHGRRDEVELAESDVAPALSEHFGIVLP